MLWYTNYTLLNEHLSLFILKLNDSLVLCKLCAQGIWVGLMGGTFMQTLILVWVTWRTDWNKEVILF